MFNRLIQVSWLPTLSTRRAIWAFSAFACLVTSAAPSHAAGTKNVGTGCSPEGLSLTPLVSVTSESRPGTVYRLKAILNDEEHVTGLFYSGSSLGNRCFTLEDIRKNALLVNVDGRDIVLVKAVGDFSSEKGGSLDLTYLHDGIFGTYRHFDMDLERSRNWQLEKEGTPFNSIFLPKRTNAVGITVGVEAPQISWK